MKTEREMMTYSVQPCTFTIVGDSEIEYDPRNGFITSADTDRDFSHSGDYEDSRFRYSLICQPS